MASTPQRKDRAAQVQHLRGALPLVLHQHELLLRYVLARVQELDALGATVDLARPPHEADETSPPGR
jgi:hypothetical protein